MSISCIASSSSLALTEPAPGRKLARTRYAVGAEAQVEARRLELVVDDRLEGEDLLPLHHRLQLLARQDAGRVRARAFVVGLGGGSGARRHAGVLLGLGDEIGAGRGHGRWHGMAFEAGAV